MRRGSVTVIIPNPHEGDIGVGFLTRLLRQAGVSRDEWLQDTQDGADPHTARPVF